MAILTLCAFWWKLGSQRCRKNAGATPLYIAAANGHLDTSRFLVESGAAKDQAAHDGTTPYIAVARPS
jgi:ankyrin repeat protein